MTNPASPDTTPTTAPHAGDAIWTWQRGGSATVINLDGDSLTVHSTVAFPPGAPLSALSQNRLTFEMKVRTCRKLQLGMFEITGKLVNATRSRREQLNSAVTAQSSLQR